MPDTCRAVVCSEFGGPEVLHVEMIDPPDPNAGEVRVAVRAAGVNPIDWKQRSGRYPVTLPFVPGVEFAGVVNAVGDGVTEFAVGDEVLGSAPRSYAEFTVASVANVTAKPKGLPWQVAGGLPVVASTTYRVLTLLRVADGETLLIDGAAGGVGIVAIQAARQRGLTVIGTASEGNHDFLRALGATPVTYGDGLADRVREVAPQGVDAALDASGRGGLGTLVELVGGPERVITIADPNAAELGVRFSGGGQDENVPNSIPDVAALAADGLITIPMARSFPLEEAAEAHRLSQDGHVRGKLILLP